MSKAWIACALRVALLLALTMAPVWHALTHGPAAAMAELVEHANGHSHEDASGGAFGDHDAADHEHQLQAVLGSPHEGAGRLPGTAWWIAHRRAGSVAREGPERPPRGSAA